MISRRVGIVTITAGTAATLAVIGACNDVSAPRRSLQQTPPISRDWITPDAPSAYFAVDPLYGGYSDSTALISHFPEQTTVYLIGSGFSVRHDVSGMNQPDGTYNAYSVSLQEVMPNGSTQWITFPNNGGQASDTVVWSFIPGSSLTKVVRPSWSPSNLTIRNVLWNGHWINCSPTTTPCYTFSGGQTISVVPIPASFTARSDSATYAIGSTAKIAMTTSPLLILGSHTPIHIDSALWAPAADSLGGDAADTIPLSGCSNYRWDDMYHAVDWLCDHPVKGAGLLTLIGHANGYRVAAPVPISLSGPTLKLTVNRPRTHVGDTVTFTPSWSDGAAIVVSSWKWKPDSLPNLITQDGGDCTSSQTTCTRPIRQNGTMFVTVTRNGRQRTARARVTVYTTFALVADSSTAHAQSNVRFTPQTDGKTEMAQRWRWAPQDPAVQDNTTCTADTTCVKQMVTTGTMWAYIAASGGDSASATVTIVTDGGGCGSTSFAKSPRGLSLDCTTDPPHVVVTADHSTVVALDTVTFTAEVYSGGAHVTAVGWTWVPKLGTAWDPWTKACSGVELTCRIQLHGTGDMYYSVKDDENTVITGTAHVVAEVPEDVGDDNLVGDDPLVTLGNPNSSGTPVDETTGRSILLTGVLSGEWFYTQGCAQCHGGSFTEPAVNLANRYGDCTDFVWYAISSTLGASWPRDYDDEKMSTKMYNSRDGTQLAEHGFIQVDSASVRMGDVVVRTVIGGSGHAGIFIGWIASDVTGEYTNGFPGGWANNGWPATHDAEGHNGLTGLFSFTPKDGTVTKFFRPLRSSQ